MSKINIKINGENRQVSNLCTITSLLIAENLVERRVAVEVNGIIISKNKHSEVVLKEGDLVEIVHALGGG